MTLPVPKFQLLIYIRPMDLKKDLYLFCQAYISNRKARIEARIAAVSEALEAESKSSAGDKHETGRAMLQLEREKLGHQLAEAEKIKEPCPK